MAEWRDEVARQALAGSGKERLQKFLRGAIPSFRPVTDPVAWRRRAAALRRAALAQVYLRGWPREMLRLPPRVEWGEVLTPHPAYVVRKLRYEACPDYWVPALLYEPTALRGKVPAVLNPNGHHGGGKAVEYKQARCINLAKRGVLALNFEFLGMSELESERPHDNVALLDLTGMAGVGLFYLAMKKGLDVLVAHPHTDRRRVAMTGLSGGGWQTIVLSALDERITLSVPVAGYTSVRARVGCPEDVGDLEQAPVDLTTVLDYQDLTAMLAPRPTLQILNERDDCCFQTARTKPVIHDAVKPVFAAFGAADKFACYSNRDPGTHNYEADNRSQFYRFINQHFGLQTPNEDLPYADELYDERALLVGLPSDRLSYRELALARARRLTSELPTPKTPAQRRQLRRKLTALLRLPSYSPRVVARGAADGASTWVLGLGAFHVPVSARMCQPGREATLLLADSGRAAWANHPVTEGESIFAADILGLGENAGDHGLLMTVDCAGHRVLGIRVAQVLATADFIAARTGIERLHLQAVGMNCGITALLAAALRPDRFWKLTANDLPLTYLSLYDWMLNQDAWQTSSCFGLLTVADLPQMVELLEHVELHQPGRCAPPRRARPGKE